MKRLFPILVLSVFIILGISFLVMVLRMVWFPPSSMGMMMGRNMMYHHMFSMLSQSLWIILIIVGLIYFIWMIKKNRKKKRK
jgi:hypothetical protein